jgi:hypothetical protein
VAACSVIPFLPSFWNCYIMGVKGKEEGRRQNEEDESGTLFEF